MKKHVYHIDQVTARINNVVVSASFTLDTEKFGYFIVLWIRSGNVIQVIRKSYMVTGDDLAAIAAHDDFEALKADLLSHAVRRPAGSSVTTAAAPANKVSSTR